MKEIGTFKIDKNMCWSCREDENCPQKYSVNGNCLYAEKDLVKEQVPENFSELKELCREIKTDAKIFFFGDAIKIEKPSLIMYFEDTGIIYINATIFVQSRTPAQMWTIIKSLVGDM